MYRTYKEETVDRAIAKGLEELNVTEADVKIDVEDGGKRGLLGFGKKDAVVRLTIINPELKTYESIEALIARDAEKADSIIPEAPDETQEEPDEEPKAQEAPEETETTSREADAPEEEGPAGKAAQMTIEEAAEKTRAYIERVIADMNIERQSDIHINQNEIYIELQSPMAAKLIGKRGATLNALQEVGQHFFNSIYKSYGAITLDVENYRAKRRETLENLAVNMSKKALRLDEPVRLEPMPSFERKIMHNALSRIDGIETHSEGSEPNRYIVIEKK